MRRFPTFLLPFILSTISLGSLAQAAPSSDPLAEVTQRISDEVLRRGHAYSDLEELTRLGHRLSGSSGAARAIQWAKAKMLSYHFDRVWLQPMSAPRWERGSVERATALVPDVPVDLKVTALGDSVGTEGKPIEAEVIEVHSLDEVAKLGDSVRGKIVFYNRPMDASLADSFDAYDGAVDQRTAGPSQAAKYGAVAALVRSMTTLTDDDHPHTGALHYAKDVPMIPAAALSTHAANVLSQLLKQNAETKVRLELSTQRLAPVKSYNVIGELKGKEFPGEYVVVSGHLDSWDLATGAQDDGPGVVQSIETLRALKSLGIRPKRTLRAVLFMSEEFGGFGGKEYARQAQEKGEKHIGALESDRGGFSPTGFAVDGDANTLSTVRSWQKYLAMANAAQIDAGDSGTDVEPLDALKVATFGLIPEPKHYFDFHHSALDRIEAVKKSELQAGAAAMAVFTYLVSEKGVEPVRNRQASR